MTGEINDSKRHHKQEVERLELKHLRSQRLGDAASLILQGVAVLVAISSVALIAAVSVEALRDRSIVIEAFSVPDDLTHKGLTGDFFAEQAREEFGKIAWESYSDHQPQPVDQDHRGDVSIEIPQTSISVAQLLDTLARSLGNRTVVTGRIAEVGNCLFVSVTDGNNPTHTFEVPPDDVPLLNKSVAELIMERHSPFTLAMYLIRQSGRRQREASPDTKGTDTAPGSNGTGGPHEEKKAGHLQPAQQNAQGDLKLPASAQLITGAPVALPAAAPAATDKSCKQSIDGTPPGVRPDEEENRGSAKPNVPRRIAGLLQSLLDSESPADRAWGYVGLSRAYLESDSGEALRYAQAALVANPDFVPGLLARAGAAAKNGDYKSAYESDRAVRDVLKRGEVRELTAAQAESALAQEAALVARYEGGFLIAADADAEVANLQPPKRLLFTAVRIDDLVLAHDIGLASKLLLQTFGKRFSDPPETFLASNLARIYSAQTGSSFSAQDTSTVAENLIEAYVGRLSQTRDWGALKKFAQLQKQSGDESKETGMQLAYASAMMDKHANLNALSRKEWNDDASWQDSLGDIYFERDQLNMAVAAYGRAHFLEKTSAFHLAGLAYALSKQGDGYSASQVKFADARKLAPRNADVLGRWGEMLTLGNRSDLALEKFEEANKYAPNWGRLHLKWGEALWWSGNRDEAKKQFAIARTLDLTAGEKAELAKAG